MILGRTDKARCMVLTSRMDPKNDKMWTSMDLLQAVSQCHNGDEDTQAAYNIIAGMFVSSLEGRALTGKDTTNFLDLWINAPKGTSLVFIPPDEEDSEGRLQILEEMIKEGNYPDRLIETVFNTSKAIFVPDKLHRCRWNKTMGLVRNRPRIL